MEMMSSALAHDLITSDWPATTATREVTIQGKIIDSWVEPSGTCDWDSLLVLQVVPRGRGHSRELLIVEADAQLAPDLGWLTDLGENLCHGCPVRIEARPTRSGFYRATHLEFCR